MTLQEIQHALARRQPQLVPATGRQGAVAMLLIEGPATPEMLFIERARRAGDPWSGDIGFPGGKVESEDAGPKEAAEREVLEEIGLCLAGAKFLGQLDDLNGDHLPIVVSCFVYALETFPSLTFNEEVVSAFWVPLPDLLDPARRLLAPVRFGKVPLVRPAIRLLPPGRTVLWGLTLRLVQQILGHLGHALEDSGEWRA